MENTPKFPYNQVMVAGEITKVRFDENRSKANIDILIPHGEKQSPRYLKVFISGKDKVENLTKAIEEYNFNTIAAQHDSPVPVMFKGIGYFENYKGNDNFSCLVSDSLEKNGPNFFIPRTDDQVKEFKETYNSKSYEKTANIKIFGRLTQDPKIITTAKGEFAELSIAHNYSRGSGDNKENLAMYAKVIIPSSQLEQFNSAGYQKGTAVNLNATIQPRAYENKAGEKKYTFNLVSNSIAPDLTKVINKTTSQEQSNSEQKEEKVKKETKTEKKSSKGKDM